MSTSQTDVEHKSTAVSPHPLKPADPARKTNVSSDVTLIAKADTLMREYMAGYDSSHDILHIRRVKQMASRLADSIPGVDKTVVVLGALFHDLIDHKYVANDSVVQQRLHRLHNLMRDNGLDEKRCQSVLKIVENSGYSIERRLRAAGQWSPWHQTCKEFHCVQDADRLDAIGSVGILRVAAYAERTDSPLTHPDETVDSAHKHFYDKLLDIKDTLKTDLGKAVGATRQKIMLGFLRSLEAEVSFDDFEKAKKAAA